MLGAFLITQLMNSENYTQLLDFYRRLFLGFTSLRLYKFGLLFVTDLKNISAFRSLKHFSTKTQTNLIMWFFVALFIRMATRVGFCGHLAARSLSLSVSVCMFLC